MSKLLFEENTRRRKSGILQRNSYNSKKTLKQYSIPRRRQGEKATEQDQNSPGRHHRGKAGNSAEVQDWWTMNNPGGWRRKQAQHQRKGQKLSRDAVNTEKTRTPERRRWSTHSP